MAAAASTRSGNRRIRAPGFIPAPARHFIQLLYYDILLPDDTFQDRTRKACLSAVSPFGVLVAAAGIFELATEPFTASTAVAGISATLALIVPIAYCFVRVTHTFPFWLMRVLIIVAWIAEVGGSLAGPNLPALALSTFGLWFTQLLHLPNARVYHCLWGLALLQASYNNAAFGTAIMDDAPPALYVPRDTLNSGYAARFGGSFTAMIAAVLVSLGVGTVIADYQHHLATESRTSTLARLVANLLVTYRTDHARRVIELARTVDISLSLGAGTSIDARDESQQHQQNLRSAAAHTAICDPAAVLEMELATNPTLERDGTLLRLLCGADPLLIDALEVIVDNMDQYRPHLPNWLVRDGTGGLAAGQEDAMRGDGGGGEDCSQSTCSMSTASRSAVSVVPVPQYRLPLHPRRAHLALAKLRYSLGCDVEQDRRRRQVSRAIAEFVRGVQTTAKATGGALHSFVGDTITVSWGAVDTMRHASSPALRFLATVQRFGAPSWRRTESATQPGDRRAQQQQQNPARGASLARELAQHDANAFPQVYISGAAMTGAAVVQLAGRREELSLTVHAPWQAALDSLEAVARRFQTILVDEAIAGSGAATTRAVCALRVPWVRRDMRPSPARSPAHRPTDASNVPSSPPPLVDEEDDDGDPVSDEDATAVRPSTPNLRIHDGDYAAGASPPDEDVGELPSTEARLNRTSQAGVDEAIAPSHVMRAYEVLEELPGSREGPDDWLHGPAAASSPSLMGNGSHQAGAHVITSMHDVVTGALALALERRFEAAAVELGALPDVYFATYGGKALTELHQRVQAAADAECALVHLDLPDTSSESSGLSASAAALSVPIARSYDDTRSIPSTSSRHHRRESSARGADGHATNRPVPARLTIVIPRSEWW